MELATQLRKQPAFQTSEFFIMVTGKNEVNLFPGYGPGSQLSS
jgi:hypothetical protein